MFDELKNLHKIIIVIAAVLCTSIIFSAGETKAAPPITCMDQGSTSAAIQCCPQLKGLFYKLDDCTRSVLKFGVDTSVGGLVTQIAFAVRVIMIMAMIIFGIRVATGAYGQRIKGSAFIFIIKIALVSALIMNLGINQYTGAITSAGLEIAAMVTGGAFGGGTVWEQVDRVFFSFFGFIGDNITTGTSLTIALVFVGLLFSGPLGSMVIGLTVGAIFFTAMAFVTAVYTGFMATVALTFMIMIAPITVPLFIFNPNTIPRGIFNAWLKQVFSYSLQVPVLYAYLAIMLLVFQSITGAGMASPPPTSILGMLQNPPIVFRPIIDLRLIQIPFPVLNWDLNTLTNFIFLVFIAFIMAVSMISFLKGLPALMLRIVGDPGSMNLMGQAMGDAMTAGMPVYKKLADSIPVASKATQAVVKGTVSRGFKMAGIDLSNLQK